MPGGQKAIAVTYTLHPTPPPGHNPARSPLTRALEGIRSQFPLTNLHWKPSSRTSLRTIQSVNVDLVDLGELGTVGKEINGSVLEWPLVNLCLVSCDSDEVYKNQTRSFIRDWLSLLAARRNTTQTPLIVLVNTAANAGATGKTVFGRDKGVIAKLRTDFNTQKRDRCVQVNLPQEGRDDPATWVEVINKLKESIVTSFDTAIVEREEDVKRGEAQRVTVGWNFCTWFLLKESLAQSFEGVGLNEDALVTYEELEATFFQVLKEQNLSWFGKLGATGQADDSIPILDTTAKPYKELLQTSSISIFDFRIYVFARQASLLGKLGRITEIAKRGQWFVASLTRRLRESEGDLAEHFIESWTYTACMDIVQKCDEWSRIDRPNGDYSGLVAYESARSELLDIARIQVERIGVAVGHLPNEYPFSPPSKLTTPNEDVLFESSDNGLSESGEVEPSTLRPSLSNQQLLNAIEHVDNFRALYFTLTKRTISAYEACGKGNSVVRLKADIAALAIQKSDWNSAYDLCRNLARDCAEMFIWDPVAEFALSGALRAHNQLAAEQGEDYLNLALAYLRVQALHSGLEGKEDRPESESLARDVLDTLRSGSTAQLVDDHKAFAIQLKQDHASWSQDGEEMVTSVEVQNHLPVTTTADAISLRFVDSAGQEIQFVAGTTELLPGSNILQISCSTSTHGIFFLKESSVKLGQIEFAYPIVGVAGPKLRVLKAKRGVKMVLRMPYNIALDKQSSVVLVLQASQSEMRNVKLGMTAIADDIHFEPQDASSADSALEADEQGVYIDKLDKEARVEINIPYNGVPQSELTRARIHLTYESDQGSIRSVVDVQSVSMGLPLTVNVQDFFRPQILISHFTIASDGREHLRIGSVKLESASDVAYEAQGANRTRDEKTVVSPTQPLSCLFKIKRKESPSSDMSSVLRLAIRYRNVEDEVSNALQSAVDSIDDSDTSRTKIDRLAQRILQERSAWLQSYILTRSLSDVLKKVVAGQAGYDQQIAARLLEAVSTQDGTVTAPWRTLEIPVEVPQKRLLSTIRFDRENPEGSIYEGRAIAFNVNFSTSFTWLNRAGQAEGAQDGAGIKVVFDVTCSNDDWVILGMKKGHYVASPSEGVSHQIVLIPVRPGKLFLPGVQVQLLDPPVVSTRRPSGMSGYSQTYESEDDSPVVCETYVENAAEVVEVLPAKTSRTVLVPVAQPRDSWGT